jgi:replicative superfamily II helicase
VKLLGQIDLEFRGWDDFKIIYSVYNSDKLLETRVTNIFLVAPVKALCAERLADWSKKFGTLGLRCAEVTGDMDQNCHLVLRKNHIILTTPEKWDSMTRQWKENQSLVQHIKLILIDEALLQGMCLKVFKFRIYSGSSP